MLVERLGQVFLVVACESVVRDEIMEAKRLLQRIDPDAVGLFVNAVPMFRGTGSGDGGRTGGQGQGEGCHPGTSRRG